MSRVFQGGRTFFLSKEKPVQSWLLFPQQCQELRAQCLMLSRKMCPTRSWVSPHQMSLRVFQMKTFDCGWSRQCMEMIWRQKKWQARDRWQNFFFINSENVYKEWFDTPSRNLTHQSIEVHFLFFCWCHKDRIKCGGQWTSKSKVSFSVMRHFSQTNFVSIFSHNAVQTLKTESKWVSHI